MWLPAVDGRLSMLANPDNQRTRQSSFLLVLSCATTLGFCGNMCGSQVSRGGLAGDGGTRGVHALQHYHV